MDSHNSTAVCNLKLQELFYNASEERRLDPAGDGWILAACARGGLAVGVLQLRSNRHRSGGEAP